MIKCRPIFLISLHRLYCLAEKMNRKNITMRIPGFLIVAVKSRFLLISKLTLLDSDNTFLQFNQLLLLMIKTSRTFLPIKLILTDNLIQHLLKLSKSNSFVTVIPQHLYQNLLQILIVYHVYEFVNLLVVDCVCVEIVDIVKVSKMHHTENSHPQSKNCAFVGDSICGSLKFKYFESFRRIVELLVRVEIELVQTQIGTDNLANTILIDDDIVRIERVVQKLQFANMTHGKYNAAQDRHDLFVCEGPP